METQAIIIEQAKSYRDEADKMRRWHNPSETSIRHAFGLWQQCKALRDLAHGLGFDVPELSENTKAAENVYRTLRERQDEAQQAESY